MGNACLSIVLLLSTAWLGYQMLSRSENGVGDRMSLRRSVREDIGSSDFRKLRIDNSTGSRFIPNRLTINEREMPQRSELRRKYSYVSMKTQSDNDFILSIFEVAESQQTDLEHKLLRTTNRRMNNRFRDAKFERVETTRRFVAKKLQRRRKKEGGENLSYRLRNLMRSEEREIPRVKESSNERRERKYDVVRGRVSEQRFRREDNMRRRTEEIVLRRSPDDVEVSRGRRMGGNVREVRRIESTNEHTKSYAWPYGGNFLYSNGILALGFFFMFEALSGMARNNKLDKSGEKNTAQNWVYSLTPVTRSTVVS